MVQASNLFNLWCRLEACKILAAERAGKVLVEESSLQSFSGGESRQDACATGIDFESVGQASSLLTDNANSHRLFKIHSRMPIPRAI